MSDNFAWGGRNFSLLCVHYLRKLAKILSISSLAEHINGSGSENRTDERPDVEPKPGQVVQLVHQEAGEGHHHAGAHLDHHHLWSKGRGC